MRLETQMEELLTKDEQQSLDNLLTSARKFHYTAIVLTGLSIALSSLETITDFELPIGKIEFPTIHTSIGLYMLVLILSFASKYVFEMASPYLKLDRRRPPFAWIALGSKTPTLKSVIFWLLIPVLLSAISTASILNNDNTNVTIFIFAGIFFVLLPWNIKHNWQLIQNRQDERGGAATFSIWLLYWYRLFYGLLLSTGLFFSPIFAIIPKWQEFFSEMVLPLVILASILYVLRIIAGIPFIYRFIDRFGKKLNFPIKSKNYN